MPSTTVVPFPGRSIFLSGDLVRGEGVLLRGVSSVMTVTSRLLSFKSAEPDVSPSPSFTTLNSCAVLSLKRSSTLVHCGARTLLHLVSALPPFAPKRVLSLLGRHTLYPFIPRPGRILVYGSSPESTSAVPSLTFKHSSALAPANLPREGKGRERHQTNGLVRLPKQLTT